MKTARLDMIGHFIQGLLTTKNSLIYELFKLFIEK